MRSSVKAKYVNYNDYWVLSFVRFSKRLSNVHLIAVQ
jgi:hypothetical protein